MWTQRRRWQYWNGNRAVELGRSIIQYKIVDAAIRRFAVPYTGGARQTITAVESDLRQWSWECATSAPVEPVERVRILEDMREALCVPGITLRVLQKRPQREDVHAGKSPMELAAYLAELAGELRDIGDHAAADTALYASVQFSTSNPSVSDFLDSAREALRAIHDVVADKLGAEDASRIQRFIVGP